MPADEWDCGWQIVGLKVSDTQYFIKREGMRLISLGNLSAEAVFK